MEQNFIYCPVVGRCPHQILIKPNRFFLIEPWDNNKDIREKTVERALNYILGKNFELSTADKEIKNLGIYCDICQKIQSSIACIVDLSPRIASIDGDRKLFIRSNVLLELGLAYGFQKPTVVITKKFPSFQPLPSDIEFLRYILFNGNWNNLSKKIATHLNGIPYSYLEGIKSLIPFNILNESKKYIETILYCLNNKGVLSTKKILIIGFTKDGYGNPIAVVNNPKILKEGLIFDYFEINNGIESLQGRFQITIVQEKIAQAKLIDHFSYFEYWDKLFLTILKSDSMLKAQPNKLVLFLPEKFKKVNIEEFSKIDKILKLI